MKNLFIQLFLTCIGIILMFCFYYMGQISGKEQERKEILNQIHETCHAPGPVEIGDSTYIVRYYPLN